MRMVREFLDFPSAYSSIDDIPEHLRLHNFTERFDGMNLWHVYEQDEYYDDNSEFLRSDRERQRLNNAATSWKEICEDHQCHHALANPSVVDTWCQELLNDMKARTALHNYLKRINRFYRYLMWHVDYPHMYNPVQFAVVAHSTPRQVWNEWEDKYEWRDYVE